MSRGISVYTSFDQEIYEQLALEHTLVQMLTSEDVTLFFWTNKPCVVIGKHQNPWRECDLFALKQRGVDLCRRETGGGAVYQDLGNLNVSLMAGDMMIEGVLKDALKEALRSLDIPVTLSGRNDLLLPDGRKCCGMAFGERCGRILEHACLLVRTDLSVLEACLTPSEKKKASKGVASVRKRVGNLSEYCPELTISTLCAAIAQSVAAHLHRTLARQEDLPKVAETQVLHMKSYDWNIGWQMRFTLEAADRFNWGEIQIQLSLKKGRIIDVCIYTDALESVWITELEEKLKGSMLTQETLQDKLRGIKDMSDDIRRDILKMLAITIENQQV